MNDTNTSAKTEKPLMVKLLMFEHTHPRWYGFLDAIIGMLVKPIPLFIILFIFNNDSLGGGNIIQNGITFIMVAMGQYLAAIMIYLIFLAVIQVYKLFFSSDKKLTMRISIFDIIMKLGARKALLTKEEYEMYAEHENRMSERKFKIGIGQKRAGKRFYQKSEEDIEYAKKAKESYNAKLEQDLEYAKKELERYQQYYEYNKAAAERKYKSAREGDGLLQTAKDKRKEANEYTRKAFYDGQDIDKIQQKIEQLERKLGKRK